MYFRISLCEMSYIFYYLLTIFTHCFSVLKDMVILNVINTIEDALSESAANLR